MQRQIIVTADGSHSVSIPEMNVTYHSVHGAIQESQHVFIEAGFGYWSGRSNRPDQLLHRSGRFRRPERLNIFEVGFGTGLNALLTLIETEKINTTIHYTAIELFPLKEAEFSRLNYCAALNQPGMQDKFEKMHFCNWEETIEISPEFSLFKTNQSLLNFKPNRFFDIVYFDAFAPTAQPELWTKEVFELLYKNMSDQSVLVTYCSKGDVRRAMLAAGFSVEKIPGPPGKREMLRAIKTN